MCVYICIYKHIYIYCIYIHTHIHTLIFIYFFVPKAVIWFENINYVHNRKLKCKMAAFE